MEQLFFIQSGVIDIFPKLKMAAAVILDLLGGGPMGLSTKAHLWCLPPVKFRHDRLSTFQVIRIWIFSRSGLKVIFTTPNFIFLGVLPHNLGTLFRPQKALPFAEQRVLSPHWSRSDARCDLWPYLRNQKKEKKTVANWLFAQTTHVAISKSKVACRVAFGV